MRILHLITRMDRGGSAVNTLICATEQARAGHQVVLACGPSHESDMSPAEQAAVDEGMRNFEQLGGKVVILPSLLRGIGLHDWRALGQIRRLLWQGFDVVHTHTSKAGALGRIAAKGMQGVVHTPHGHIFHGYFGALKTALFRWLEYWLARHSDALIALTEAERHDHLQLHIGRPEQWHVIPSGVDVEGIRLRVAAMKQQDLPTWDVVSVGRLVPIKGMERLLKAWAEVIKIRPEAKLALVGDGEDRDALQALCRKLGIDACVHFAGWADPLPYLASARCFTLLSYNEGMGRAVVEAMAAGLPCVVSNVCGLQELVDDTVGQVVNADVPQEVATALLKEFPDDVSERLAKRADQYSVKAMIDGLQGVYAHVTSH